MAGLTVTNQGFGVASTSTGFTVDGIIGLGPVVLTEKTVAGVSEVPTFTNTLKSENKIVSLVFLLRFQFTHLNKIQ